MKIDKKKDEADNSKIQQVLNVALQLFGRRGFYEPTMDDLAVESGYSRRNLYRLFRTKDEVQVILGLQCGNKLLDSLGQIQEKPLEEIVWAYYQFTINYPLEYQIVLDTRQRIETNSLLSLSKDWLEAEQVLVSMLINRFGMNGKEKFIAAIGYIEFHFRYDRLSFKDGDLIKKEVFEDTLKSMVK